MTLRNLLANQTEARQLFIQGHQRSLSYGDQFRRNTALADWLDRAGIGFGALVLLAVDDDLERASLLTALVLSGRAPIVFDPGASLAEATVALSAVDYACVIADQRHVDDWQIDLDKTPVLKVQGATASKGMLSRLLSKRTEVTEATVWPALANDVEPKPPVPVEEEALAYLVFTSGTTSRPKGVEITRRALLSQMQALVDQYRLHPGDRIMNTLPLHHVDGYLQGPLMAWFAGAALYRAPCFTPQGIADYLTTIYRERITHLIAAPTMLDLMLRLGTDERDCFKGGDFAFVSCSGGPLRPALWEAFEAAFETLVVNMYGMSETGTSALFSGPDGESRLMGTVGLPVNCEVRIVDGEGQDVGSGEPGELLIKSEQLLRGYYRDPDATRAVLVDGWLKTGDLARFMPGGHVELVGRKKNIIISGGRNISPEEVEAVLAEHPEVAEAVLVGIEDETFGERAVALLVAVHEDGLDADAVIEHCRASLSEYKIPKEVRMVAALPRTESGKVRLDAARNLAATRVQPERTEAEGDINQIVIDLASRVFRTPAAGLSLSSAPDNTPGWDSLAHMELVLEIEREFGIELDAPAIMSITSLDVAVELIRTAR